MEKKNGYGKEYNERGLLIFEGEYSNGEKIKGNIYEYYSTKNRIKFEGTYLNGKKFDGIGYDINNNIIYTLNNGRGYVKEFNVYYDYLEYEGEYVNGEKNGKGKAFDHKGNIIFEGEYKNDHRWNGKLFEFDYKEIKRFEGEYINGKLKR